MKIMSLTILSLASLALTACGTSNSDRALSGGGIGAGVGAGAAVLTGGSLATGAVLGGAIGAATGVLTDENDINLDKK